MSALIAYFSASAAGITKKAAEKIASLTNDPLYRIEPAVAYTQADLNWMDETSRSTKESKDPSMKIELKNALPDLKDVDTLFIGFPVWWYNAPRIVYTFMNELDLKGKTIIPFCTSGGTDMRTCENKMKSVYPDLDWKKGMRITTTTKEDQIENWIKEVA